MKDDVTWLDEWFSNHIRFRPGRSWSGKRLFTREEFIKYAKGIREIRDGRGNRTLNIYVFRLIAAMRCVKTEDQIALWVNSFLDPANLARFKSFTEVCAAIKSKTWEYIDKSVDLGTTSARA